MLFRGGVSVVCAAALGRPAKVSPIEHAIVRIFDPNRPSQDGSCLDTVAAILGTEFRMSLVVKLEDDLGERSEWVILHGVIPDNSEIDFPTLRCVDPFGKTVFNHLQAEVFLSEWERVKDRAKDESQREAWQKVKEMAQTCKSDRDLYLRFVGH